MVQLTVEKLCDRLDKICASAASAGRPVCVVGIAGGPGSGKSTIVASCLKEMLRRHGSGFAAPLPMDGFHLPRTALDAMDNAAEAHAKRGAPFTFDAPAFVACLRAIRGAGCGTAPSFDHAVGDPLPDAISIAQGTRLLLVEGNYLLLGRLAAGGAFVEASGRPLDPAWREVESLCDQLWYIETSVDIAMERVAKRNMSNPGWEDLTLEQVRARVDTNDRVNAELVARCASVPDFSFAVVDNLAGL
eukprot:gene2165-3082_t